MKGKKLFLLCSVIFLMACKDNAETIPDDKTEERPPQSDQARVEDSLGKGEASESETNRADISKQEPWEQAYLDYLDAFEVSNSCTYSLIYVDEDKIPELVIDTGVEAGGCEILTWHEDVMDVLQTFRLHFTYIEKGNLLCNSDGNMGYYYDNVYAIKDGLWEFVGGGTYSDPAGGPKLDKNEDFIYEYHWLEQPVERSEYERKFHAIYPEKEGKIPDVYYIKDEMYSILKTKETTSVTHRYELIVEDLTWTEAYMA